MQKNKHKMLIAALLASAIGTATIGTTTAYLTDRTSQIPNKYTIALDTVSKIVERFPEITPEQVKDPVIQYEKSVAVINAGYVDEYIRVRVDFSDNGKNGITYVTQADKVDDSTNWYKWSDFCEAAKNGLNGWYYNDDGYFYYNEIVEAGDWEKISSDETKLITRNAEDGHYNYVEGKDEENIRDYNKNIVSGKAPNKNIITKKLITYIRTEFGNYSDMEEYGIYIYNESCPFYFATSKDETGYAKAKSAWDSYLSDQGRN